MFNSPPGLEETYWNAPRRPRRPPRKGGSLASQVPALDPPSGESSESVPSSQETQKTLRRLHPASACDELPVRVSHDDKGQHVGVLDPAGEVHHLLLRVITVRRERDEASLEDGSNVRPGDESLHEAPTLASQLPPELDEDLFTPLYGRSVGIAPLGVPVEGPLIVEVWVGL